MAQSNWEADKMLDVYIHDYMLKRELVESAKAFMAEGKVASDPVAIDAPGGFLFEWWSVFWDIFIARTNERHSEAAATYIQAQQMKTREHQQQAQMQQLQPMQRSTSLLQRDPNNPALGGPGLVPKNKGTDLGVTGLPLKGWPLTGMDQLRPNLGLQVQRPNLQSQNQFLLASQQQQILAQGQVQGNLGNSPNFGFASLPRASLNVGQPARNDGVVGSPSQSSSPMMRMAQMQQQSFQQQAQLQQQQQQQNNRKRKSNSSCGPTNSTGTANTVGPSPNSPASAHTPGDGINTASSVQQTNSVPKSLMMFNGAGGLASSSNNLDDLENFGVGSLDDTLDSFLSPDGGDGREQYGSLKQGLTEHKTDTSRGFSFGEVGCIKEPNKFTCCHFSSDGKLLASGGHDKKVVLWNVDTKEKETAAEEHQHVITDVRFRPNSTQLATASFDKSVRLWDAANPSYSLDAHTGHHSPVMSLDFHPKKNNLLCFCDSSNEIQYWNVSPFTCSRISKQRGSAQVRFQPRSGHVLAGASDTLVSIFDVETDRQIHSFQGHSNVVNYMSWNLTGEYLATVSVDTVKVWSLSSGECIHELSSNGNQFHSCVFHPNYSSSLLVIGGLRSLELWNMAENRSMTIAAHDTIVSALAQSPVNGMVASASHDSSVKLWK